MKLKGADLEVLRHWADNLILLIRNYRKFYKSGVFYEVNKLSLSPTECAYCLKYRAFVSGDYECTEDCPVLVNTGQYNCRNTPYEQVTVYKDLLIKFNYRSIEYMEKLIKSVWEEYLFLKKCYGIIEDLEIFNKKNPKTNHLSDK